jgi:hypothetical protein
MTSQDLKDLLDYIQENNSWENMMDCADNDRRIYKYIDLNICWDTRDTNDGNDPHLWWVNVKLRDGRDEKLFEEHECTLDNIKAFLDLPSLEAKKQLTERK